MDERKKAEEILHRKKAVSHSKWLISTWERSASWVRSSMSIKKRKTAIYPGRRSVVYRGRRCGPGDHNAGRQCDS